MAAVGALRGWRFGFGFGVTGFCWDGYGRVDGVGVASCGIAEHGATEICCCTSGPPCVAQPVEKTDTLLQLLCGAVDVHL